MKKKIAVIGGGAAGMFAARMRQNAGCEVHLFEKMKNWAKRSILQEKADVI